jgi:hypothetical protein
MRTSSKTREGISRREFAKLVSAAAFAAPLAIPVAGEQKKSRRKNSRSQPQRQPKILTHIPPIDMMNGSFIVRTNEPLDDDIPNDHTLAVGKRPRKHRSPYGEVRWVRITAANGDMVFDGFGNDLADRAQIAILFDGLAGDDANILIRKEDMSSHISFETTLKLVTETGSSTHHRRRYNNPGVQIKHVRIHKPGTTDPLVFSSNEERQLEQILVWTYE